jgi:Mrp family chromosome partitioning ATPase
VEGASRANAEQAALATGPQPRAPSTLALIDPLSDLRASERQAQANLDAARRDLALQRSRFTEKHPAVVAAVDLLSEAEQAHERAAEALRAASAARTSAEEQAGASRDRAAGSSSRRAAASIAEAEAEFARLTRRVAEERERLQKLDARQFVASIAASSASTGHGARIDLIDPAYAPSQPSGTRPLVLLIFGIAGSLSIGLALALLLAILDDRVYDRQDVERLGLAPIVAEVLRLPARAVGGHEVATVVDQWQPMRLALPPSSVAAHPAGQSPAPVAVDAAAVASQDANASRQEDEEVPVFAEAVTGTEGSEGSSTPNFTMPFAAVPGMSSPVEAPSTTRIYHSSSAVVAASFRVLRHRLSERTGLRTILVTSPSTGEGKTTCAVNLALATCEAGRARVLLVDANLQHPSLGQLLGLPPRELPQGSHVAQRWSTVQAVTPWLHVATPAPGAPASFVDAFSVHAGLEELGVGQYDSVIIDGPPVLGSADANLFEECVDGILLTMWARRSHASTLRDAVNQLSSPKVLGVVLMR